MVTAQVGDKLRADRNALGLSQTDISRTAYLDAKTVSNVELGATSVTLATLYRIAKVLGAPVWYYLLPERPTAYAVKAKELEKLVEFYIDTDPEGRKMILRIAKLEKERTDDE